MLINFGITLKNLRHKKDMTQEQVAEFLNTTSQSVSRWETGATYPDIEMLPLIATFYGVTVDYLLGVDNQRVADDIAEYKRIHQEYQNKGDLLSAYDITREYYAKYPSDPIIMFAIVEDGYMKARNIIDDKNKKNQLLNETIELAKRHVTQFADGNERSAYHKIIAYCYKTMDDSKTAIEYVKMLPNIYNCREGASSIFYDGLEKVEFLQNNIFMFLDELQRNIWVLADVDYDNTDTTYQFDERIKILKKIIDIYNIMFEAGDFGFQHTRLYMISRKLAACYANKKDIEETLKYLDMSKNHAVAFDKLNGIITHTSLIFNQKVEDSSEYSSTMKWNNSHELLEKLQQDRYSFLLENKQFISITDELKKHAKHIK